MRSSSNFRKLLLGFFDCRTTHSFIAITYIRNTYNDTALFQMNWVYGGRLNDYLSLRYSNEHNEDLVTIGVVSSDQHRCIHKVPLVLCLRLFLTQQTLQQLIL